MIDININIKGIRKEGELITVTVSSVLESGLQSQSFDFPIDDFELIDFRNLVEVFLMSHCNDEELKNYGSWYL